MWMPLLVFDQGSIWLRVERHADRDVVLSAVASEIEGHKINLAFAIQVEPPAPWRTLSTVRVTVETFTNRLAQIAASIYEGG